MAYGDDARGLKSEVYNLIKAGNLQINDYSITVGVVLLVLLLLLLPVHQQDSQVDSDRYRA